MVFGWLDEVFDVVEVDVGEVGVLGGYWFYVEDFECFEMVGLYLFWFVF